MYTGKVVLVVLMLLAIAGAAQASVDISNSPFLTTVRAVVQDHPPGCLHARSVVITLRGYLVGIVVPATLQEAMPARAALYLQLYRPISVCASDIDEPVMKQPAYVNVSRIGMGAWSVATYQLIMRKWSMRISAQPRSTLTSAALSLRKSICVPIRRPEVLRNRHPMITEYGSCIIVQREYTYHQVICEV